MTFSSEECKLQTVWIWNPGKFPSFCTGVLKMYNFGLIPPASWLIELYTVFWTFLDFTKMWTRWNFESIFLKIAQPAKGSFWRNKRKSEFSELSWHSPYLQAMAIFCHCSFPTFFLPFSSPFSRFFCSRYLLHFISFRDVAKSVD